MPSHAPRGVSKTTHRAHWHGHGGVTRTGSFARRSARRLPIITCGSRSCAPRTATRPRSWRRRARSVGARSSTDFSRASWAPSWGGCRRCRSRSSPSAHPRPLLGPSGDHPRFASQGSRPSASVRQRRSPARSFGAWTGGRTGRAATCPIRRAGAPTSTRAAQEGSRSLRWALQRSRWARRCWRSIIVCAAAATGVRARA